MKIGDSLLRVARSLKDGALVVFEDLDPRGDISRMIVARFRRKPQIRCDENTAELGNNFL